MRKVNQFILIALVLSLNLAIAQKNKNYLTKEEKQETITSISKLLKKNYVFPDMANKMVNLLNNNLKNKKYKSIKDPVTFADKLTEDLRSVNEDLHLRVKFDPDWVKDEQKVVSKKDSIALINKYKEYSRRNNFGFEEVKVLDGNIGYLKLNGFDSAEFGGKTAVAAMNFLCNSDALIVDLRRNGGGSPDMIQLITSYLFGSESVHLNTFYHRTTDSYSHTYTLPHVSGKRRPDIDVYVLTSKRTFSAAEEFSYNLKNLKRATLIGETTGGGAHPGRYLVASDKFAIFVPNGRAINPITKTNWEGMGVIPHIKIPQEEALVKAQILALEKLQKENPNNKKYEAILKVLKARENPINLDVKVLEKYIGTYDLGNKKEILISLECGKLVGEMTGDTFKSALLPLDNSEFFVETNKARVFFDIKGGKVIYLTLKAGRRETKAKKIK